MSAVVTVTLRLPREGEHLGFIGNEGLTQEAPADLGQVSAALHWLAGHFDTLHRHGNDLKDTTDKATLRHSDLSSGDIEAMGVFVQWNVVE